MLRAKRKLVNEVSNPAAGIQPGSRYPTRQQVSNLAAGIQPGSFTMRVNTSYEKKIIDWGEAMAHE